MNVAVQLPDALERTVRKRITGKLLCARWRWLGAFQKLNGFIPSYTIIGQGWGELTRAAVPLSLSLMEAQGLIRRVGRSPSRAIVLETKSEVCSE